MDAQEGSRARGKRSGRGAARRGRATRAWRACLTAITCGALLAGCTSKRRPPTEGTTGGQNSAGDDGVRSAATTSPRVTQLTPPPRATHDELAEPAIELPLRESLAVQSTGEEPRQRHRYALAAVPRRYALTATLRARELTDSLPADAPAAPVPPFTESFVLEPAASGARLYWLGDPPRLARAPDDKAGARDPAMPGDADDEETQIAPYVQRWKTLLAGRRASLALDERAMPVELTFAEDPLRASSGPERDELAQRLLALAIPLPAEPIGVGARWTAVTVMRQGLGVVKQTARYELIAATEQRLTVALDVRRVGEEQRIAAASVGLPPGASLELIALFRGVTGRVELELTAPLPVSGALTIEARSHQRLQLPDQPAREVITEDTGELALTSELTSRP